MRAINLESGNYYLRECIPPQPGAQEVLIRVAFAGVNRADLPQMQGRYPLPENPPFIPGMEVSGVIEACGAEVKELKQGDRVCALVQEGAFGEYAIAPAAQTLPVPPGITLEQAAALPEACFTIWISLVWQAQLQPGESVLIHGGTSGIGSIGIQIARLLGARVFTTCGSQAKGTLCEALGAEKAILYHEQDFVKEIKYITRGKGVDVILDMIGGSYFQRNLEALAQGGRLAIIAFQQGAKVEANLAPVLLRHLAITGSTLRPRSRAEKGRIAAELKAKGIWDAVGQGKIKPLIDSVFALENAEKALERMDQGLNVGKILLRINAFHL